MKKGGKKSAGPSSVAGDKKKDKKSISQPPSLPAGRPAYIHINVEGLKNIRGKYPTTDVLVQAEFLGTVIGESPQQALTADEFVPHQFHCKLRYYQDNPQCLDDLLNNPIVFNVFQIEGFDDLSNITQPQPETEQLSPTVLENLRLNVGKAAAKEGRESKKGSTAGKGSTVGKGSTAGKGAQPPPPKKTFLPEIIGRCNVDLLPLIVGKSSIRDIVTIEQDFITMDETMVTNTNLPQIQVQLEVTEPIMCASDLEYGNLMQISVESIYNLAPEPFMFDAMFYSFGTQMPKTKTSFEPVVITDGIVTIQPDLERAKIWCNLAGHQSRISHTAYEFDKDYLSIKNNLNIDLDELFKNYQKSIPDPVEQPDVLPNKRVEWNLMRRFWMTPEARVFFVERLKKYRKWPFEIYGTKVPPKKEIAVFDETGEVPQVTPSKKEDPPNVMPKTDIHLMGYFDLTKLLFTGITKTRVLSQLSTFADHEVRENTGITEAVFKEIPEAPKSGKSDKKKPKSPKTPVPAVDPNLPPPPPPPSIPLVTVEPDEKPTIIVAEIEMLKPFYKKRPIENLIEDLRQLIPEREQKSKKVLQLEAVEHEFQTCLEEMTRVLYAEFKKFSDLQANEPKKYCNNDQEMDFNSYLSETGVYNALKRTLKKKIYILVNEKFHFTDDPNSISAISQYINEIYVYIVKKINFVVNSFLGPGIQLKSTPEEICALISKRNLLLYAKEAEENGDLETAERYYLERIALNESNADFWLDYALFKLNQDNITVANQLVNECLSIDFNHKYGLTLLALLLMRKCKYKTAEKCLLTVVEKYPTYLPGFVILHLFYLSLHRYEGADVLYEMAMKCLHKTSQDLNEFEGCAELSWNVKFWNDSQIYVRTAVLLMKLRCFEMAEMALAQDLVSTPETKCYSYYNAVGYYLTNRYSRAISSLEQALTIHGPDLTVGGLLAHCYYKLECFERALSYYDPLLYTYDRPDDTLLIYTRITDLYRKKYKHEEALRFILLACKFDPTPYTWLQAGIIYNELEDLQNADLCLNESNFLDNKLSATWEYLAIINKKMKNEQVANVCSNFARRSKRSCKDLVQNTDTKTIVNTNIMQLR